MGSTLDYRYLQWLSQGAWEGPFLITCINFGIDMLVFGRHFWGPRFLSILINVCPGLFKFFNARLITQAARLDSHPMPVPTFTKWPKFMLMYHNFGGRNAPPGGGQAHSWIVCSTRQTTHRVPCRRGEKSNLEPKPTALIFLEAWNEDLNCKKTTLLWPFFSFLREYSHFLKDSVMFEFILRCTCTFQNIVDYIFHD